MERSPDATAELLDRSKAPAPAAIRAFEFPAVERRVLDSGMTVLSARAGDLPLVTVRAVIDAGPSAEAAGEEGLAWLTSKALAGGTAERPGADLAWDLERLGTELETAVGWDGLHVQLTVTADRIGKALDVLAEIVRQPAFPEREVNRLRAEQLAEILRRSTEPRALADDSAAHWIFADDEPYGRTVLGIEARVQTFDRDAADAYHRRRFTPGNTAIVVVGAVEPDAAVAEVERAFSGWTGAREPAPLPSTRARAERTTLYMVDRPSAAQSELRIGHVGVPRHHEDYYPLLVMNAIVAGAFTSRLNLSLREKHGFTYGVRSTFVFRRAAGPFIIQTAVGSDVTARAVEEALRELKAVQDDGVTDDEVTAARDFLAGTLPLEMQTTEQLATRLADLHTFDLPTDYFENHRAQIRAVRRADVERVAREHLRLDQLAVVVVGNADAVEADVRSVLDCLQSG
ncbi:pitrilysin family protein [soil metagenome]